MQRGTYGGVSLTGSFTLLSSLINYKQETRPGRRRRVLPLQAQFQSTKHPLAFDVAMATAPAGKGGGDGPQTLNTQAVLRKTPLHPRGQFSILSRLPN